MQNSPANRVPSHGTRLYATSYAIDFILVDDAGHTAPITLGSLLRPDPPERFPGFGRPVLAPISGVIVATHGHERDHPAYRGLPSIRYSLTQGRRAAAGWMALAGNHVLIENDGIVVALCHLQNSSIEVELGQRMRIGEPLARCGNSGNSTEPHLHAQVMDHARIEQARAVPITFAGGLPRNGTVVNNEALR